MSRGEKQEIWRLVITMCANYDSDFGCLLLDYGCFMLNKEYTGGAFCKWFRDALMPLSPETARLFGGAVTPETKPCKMCGKRFPLNGRQSYCSADCFKAARRKAVAASVRKFRNKTGEM